MLTVESLRRQLGELPPGALVDVSIGDDRTDAAAISCLPADGDQPARVIIGAAMTTRAVALERIREAMFGQGPDTPWSPDTLDEIALALRDAGLAPEDTTTQQEQEASWTPRVAALVERLNAAGYEELLDEMLHDMHGGKEAADINNGGYQAQVEAAFRALGPDAAEDQIENLLVQIQRSHPLATPDVPAGISCVVACRNASGEPDFYFCRVECPPDRVEEGAHHETAENAARDNGYEGPFVVFDEHDGPEWLFEQFAWATASTHQA
jgi:hypothetical protein